ncbi:MAG: integral rane protein [Frankiales bacterium]|nr:integral rane protein [Frankiales bacterium]
MIWTAVLLTAAGCYGFKASGWFAPASLLDRPVVRTAATLTPVALLAALVVVQVFAAGTTLTVDARVVGLAAGAVCLWRRLPFLVVIVVAAAAAAAVRAL